MFDYREMAEKLIYSPTEGCCREDDHCDVDWIKVRDAIESTLLLAHDAGVEEAAKCVETEHKVCFPLMCETAAKVRTLELRAGEGK